LKSVLPIVCINQMDWLVVKNMTMRDLKGRMYSLKIRKHVSAIHGHHQVLSKTLKIFYYINHVTQC
jgi:hypothetical protein